MPQHRATSDEKGLNCSATNKRCCRYYRSAALWAEVMRSDITTDKVMADPPVAVYSGGFWGHFIVVHQGVLPKMRLQQHIEMVYQNIS